MATGTALYGLTAEQVIKLADGPVTDAVWSAAHSKVFLLHRGAVYGLDWDGFGPPGSVAYVQGQQEILKTHTIYGLAQLPLDDGAIGIAVLTDQGLAVYHDRHFEHFHAFPLVDKTPAVYALASRNSRLTMLTSEGIVALEHGQVLVDRHGRVYDLLTVDRLGATFVARGHELQMVQHNETTAGVVPFAQIAATHLAQDRQGRLLTNDGTTILRYDPDSPVPQTLFHATPTVPHGQPAATSTGITSLLSASDGSVWVTAGSSVFRWQDWQVEEFSIFKDPERFPARSDMISRVIETIDQRLWVIASHEGHRNYKGLVLEGGVLAWTGTGFHRIELPAHTGHWSTGPWFITGYTPIDTHTAIVGTTRGFARHHNGRYTTFTALEDASYAALLARTPLLWLGTRGAKLGTNTWLFGTAGGVVAYREGAWFSPDRLNWLLPDQHLSLYGAHTVHAVATDPTGRIYVGTDRGLLVHDSGGGDAVAFLVSNGQFPLLFQATEATKVRREADILLAAVDPESALAQRIRQRNKLRRDIEALEATRVPRVMMEAGIPETRPDQAVVGHPTPAEETEQQLRAKRQEERRLLFQIGRENPGLYQALELKPLDLVSLRSAFLQTDQALLQYLPAEQQLYVHLVTREHSTVVEVHDVSNAELQRRARQAWKGLSPHSIAKADLEADLVWLYDKLLRPVEDKLLVGKFKQVFVVPVGELMYLPFAALMRTTEKGVEYAIERFTFGYLTSMYHLALVLKDETANLPDILVLGDPQGNFAAARQEAIKVARIVGGELGALLGDDASYDNLRRYGPSARIIHLSTHARLDHERPEHSFVLLANDYHLRLADIMELPIANTDLVVLSACETARGVDGMEYATIVRAFAGARVPALIATLWQVRGDASSVLMEAFYNNLDRGDDRFTALARAQQHMLRQAPPEFRPPSHWAGFVAFGKP